MVPIVRRRARQDMGDVRNRMASLISHTAVPISMAMIAGRRLVSTRLLVAAVIVSVLPDADVIGFRLGVPYEDPLGHRGLTHSIIFALFVGLAGALGHRSLRASPRAAFSMLTLATLSHGVLDAFTNGGLGVGFFIPFDLDRYFFPWRPIEVSPLGWPTWSEMVPIYKSELRAVWVPALILGIVSWLVRHGIARMWPVAWVRPSRGGQPPAEPPRMLGALRSWQVATVTAMLAIVLLVARELRAFDLNLGRLEVDRIQGPSTTPVGSPSVWSIPVPIRNWVGPGIRWRFYGAGGQFLVAPMSALCFETPEGEHGRVLVGFRDFHRRGIPWLPLFKQVDLDADIDAILEVDDGQQKLKGSLQIRVDIGVKALGIFPRRAVDEAIANQIGEILQQQVMQEVDRLRRAK
jgi:inner membrane protein